jgi:hypothetical protein
MQYYERVTGDVDGVHGKTVNLPIIRPAAEKLLADRQAMIWHQQEGGNTIIIQRTANRNV